MNDLRKSRFGFSEEEARSLGDSMIENYVRLADKVNLTKEQIYDIGLSTLKAYAENKTFDPNGFIDL